VSTRKLASAFFRAIILTALVLISVLSTRLVRAAYFIVRPIFIDTTYGYIDQTYLYGEPRPGDPNTIHKGVDFPAPLGRTVYAVANGVVVDSREDIANYTNPFAWGNFVLVQHTQQHYDRTSSQNGYVYSLYLHLRQNGVLVNDGDYIVAGQGIGEVDSTGNSSGNHLHLQIVVHPQSGRTLHPS
jgi:murein DD-endopeptidase MepM/ murein hydrolase activator NlpD